MEEGLRVEQNTGHFVIKFNKYMIFGFKVFCFLIGFFFVVYII